MTGAPLGALAAVAAAALSAAAGIARDGKLGVHAGLLPAIVSGVLVPLMLPRVGATIRRVLTADGLRLLREPVDAVLRMPAWPARADVLGDGVCTDALTELARKNARLARELGDLRTAYAELQVDAAARAAAVDRLHHLAHHDPLTQLPNRVLLMDRLEQSLAHARRAGSGVLVVYLDLDNFKTINDTLGHAAGDRVLTEVGARLTGVLRDSDTASRIGGDEFVLVCPTADAAADGARIEARLRTALAAPIDVDGVPVVTGASIGMSAFPAGAGDAAELIKQADRAMFGAKRSRRS